MMFITTTKTSMVPQQTIKHRYAEDVLQIINRRTGLTLNILPNNFNMFLGAIRHMSKRVQELYDTAKHR